MTVDCVVLAGGQNSPAMAAAAGTQNRALTKLGARTMLEYVVSALSDAPGIGKIYVVGDVPSSGAYTQVAAGETLLENLMAGLDAAGGADGERVLVSTSDIPFVTAEALEDFVGRAAASGADLCCSYVPLALCRERFPEMKRTAIKTADGEFTLGNVMLVNPRLLRTNHAAIARAYAARKSPAKVAGLLGAGLLLRLIAAQLFLPRLLTVAALEQAVGKLLGPSARAAGLCSPFPEIGTDIDSPADITIARKLLG